MFLNYLQENNSLKLLYQIDSKIIELTVSNLKLKQSEHYIMTHHYPSSNCMQYLNTLDKCTQIVREDRIWLRNQIKANNEEILHFFKAQPRIPNMKDLQIRIRKYMQKVKQQQKQEQLLRFKQNSNVHDLGNSTLNREKSQTAKSHTKSQKALKQSDRNVSNNSILSSKWNHQQGKSYILNEFPETAKSPTNLRSPKSWINNYRPHSFNRMLNGQSIENRQNSTTRSPATFKKLQTGGLMTENLKKNGATLKYDKPFNNTDRFSRKGSANSLRQLENRIYEQLNKYDQKYQKDSINSKSSHRLSRDLSKNEKQEPEQYKPEQFQSLYRDKAKSQTQPEVQKTHSPSRKNIEEVLKERLGDCNFENFRKSRKLMESENEEEYTPISSSKKLCQEGQFPPIEEQTERDSECMTSQRNQQDPFKAFFNSNKNGCQMVRNNMHFNLNSSSPKFASNYDSSADRQTSPQFNSTINPRVFEPTRNNFMGSSSPKEYREHSEQKQWANSSNKNSERNSVNEQELRVEPPLSYERSHESYLQKFNETSTEKAQLSPVNISSHKKSDSDYQSSSQQCRQASPSSTHNYQHNFRSSEPTTAFNQTLNTQELAKSYQSITNELPSVNKYQSDGLFTSPQLLSECRDFLKKTKQLEMSRSVEPVNFEVCESPLNSAGNRQKEYKFPGTNIMLLQPITITNSITKDLPSEMDSTNSFAKERFGVDRAEINLGNGSSKRKMEFTQQRVDQKAYHESAHQNKKYSENTKSNQASENIAPTYLHHQPQAFSLSDRNYHQLQESKKVQDIAADSNLGSCISSANKQDNSKHLHNEYFQTFSNKTNQHTFEEFKQSHQKQEEEGLVEDQPLQHPYNHNAQSDNYESQNKHHAQQQELNILELPNMIRLEEIVDTLLEHNEGNIQMDPSWLENTLSNHNIFSEEVGEILKYVFAEFLSPKSMPSINFLEMCIKLQKIYQHSNKNPQFLKGPSRDIYRLLDMDQKGYIEKRDMEAFIQQLQEAEVENMQEISFNIWSVFEMADFLCTGQIFYTSLYIIKNEETFQDLCRSLEDFEFQIEGQEEQ